MRVLPLLLAAHWAAAWNFTNVLVFCEAGSPECTHYLAGELNTTVENGKFPSSVNWGYITWGNAYYNMPGLNATPGVYDKLARATWEKTCAVGVPPEKCFEGGITYEHGKQFEEANTIQQCAMDVTASSTDYIRFINCFQAVNNNNPGAMSECALEFGLDLRVLRLCLEDEQFKMMTQKTMAMFSLIWARGQTSLPWVYIKDQGMPAPADLQGAILKKMK